MEPVRSLFPFATWILRVAVLAQMYMLFFTRLLTLDIKNRHFLLALAFVFFGILLFFGGFFKKHTLTIISAAVILVGCAYQLVMFFAKDYTVPMIMYCVLGSLALFFFTNGNKIK